MSYRPFEPPFRRQLIITLLLGGLVAGCASPGPAPEVKTP